MILNSAIQWDLPIAPFTVRDDGKIAVHSNVLASNAFMQNDKLIRLKRYIHTYQQNLIKIQVFLSILKANSVSGYSK